MRTLFQTIKQQFLEGNDLVLVSEPSEVEL